MKPGTLIRLPDGREGTVVYHGLDGYGIRWEHTNIDAQQIKRGDGNTMQFLGGNSAEAPEDYKYFPEAMLRNSYPGATMECVGETFKIIAEPTDAT